MDAKKALIITWIVIGLLVAGGIGFYLGRLTLTKSLNTLNNIGPGQQGPGNNQGLPGGGNQPSIQTPAGGAK